MARRATPADPDIRAVLYARISLDREGHGAGVERQLEDCRRICTERGWAIAAEVIENDVSASRYSRKVRTEWARVMDMLDNGTANALVAYDLDRLLRRYSDLEKLIDRADHGLPVVTVQGDIRLDTSDGRFVAGILTAKAAKESDDISRRTRRAKEDRASRGEAVGAVTAFGWLRTADRRKARDPMHHDPIEAAAIRAGVADVLAGKSMGDVARQWNAKGYQRPMSTQPWTTRAVRDVLISPRNAGLLQYQGEVLRAGNWPPIIDRDTYEQLRRKLNADNPGVPRRRVLFTGFLYCGICNNTLRRDTHNNGSKVWRCKGGPGEERCGGIAVYATKIEPFIVSAVLVAASDIRPALPDPAEPHVDIAKLEDELRDLATDAGAGRVSRAEWFAFRDAIQARIDTARAKVARTSRHRVELDGKTLAARWDSMTLDEQRSVLGAFLDKVIVKPSTPVTPIEDRVVIEWRA